METTSHNTLALQLQHPGRQHPDRQYPDRFQRKPQTSDIDTSLTFYTSTLGSIQIGSIDTALLHAYEIGFTQAANVSDIDTSLTFYTSTLMYQRLYINLYIDTVHGKSNIVNPCKILRKNPFIF